MAAEDPHPIGIIFDIDATSSFHKSATDSGFSLRIFPTSPHPLVLDARDEFDLTSYVADIYDALKEESMPLNNAGIQ